MFEGISAILLAAGASRRMGRPKLLLPWGDTTVLGRSVATFAAAGIGDILIVTGGDREAVEALATGLGQRYPVRIVYNPHHANGMLGSIQAGLAALPSGGRAALIGLGDQPQVRESTIESLCAAFDRSGCSLVVPSYRERRGHPWLVARPLWKEILALPISATARGFIASRAAEITYVAADDSILKDLDTPKDYTAGRP